MTLVTSLLQAQVANGVALALLSQGFHGESSRELEPRDLVASVVYR